MFFFMKKYLMVLLLIMLANCAYATGDAALGKQKSIICATCHGVDGISIAPIYPNLKGQKAPYLVNSLKAYKLGQRKGGLAAIMVPQSMALSDTDIANLAAYYSSLK